MYTRRTKSENIMSRLTNRDRIWSAALELREQKSEFRTKEVLEIANLSQNQHRTARRVLHSMKSEGWLKHQESTDLWWKPTDTVEIRPSAQRFAGVDADEACANLKKRDILEVVLHRISNSNNLIAYPKGTEFSGDEDGIHIQTSQQTLESISEAVSLDGLVIIAEVEMKSKKKAKLIKLTSIRIEPVSSESEILSNLSQLEPILDLNVNRSRNQSSKEPESPDSDLNQGEQRSESDGSKHSLPDLPPEPENRNLTQIYYVATNKAECYHRVRSCEGIKKRQGELCGVIKEIDGELPEEVSHLRRCHLCH